MTDEQIARLDSIGMIWKNKIETAWENGYHEARKYFEKYGNLDVAVSYVTENGFKLGGWIADRREQARANKLAEGKGATFGRYRYDMAKSGPLGDQVFFGQSILRGTRKFAYSAEI